METGECLISVRCDCLFMYPCDMFFSVGCQRLADYLEGVKKNYESTAQVLKHNCETYGHGESCYKLGAYHITGKGKTTVQLICGLFLIIMTFCVKVQKFYG